jgi:hypothetical protein
MKRFRGLFVEQKFMLSRSFRCDRVLLLLFWVTIWAAA